jgi:hypothetical protein
MKRIELDAETRFAAAVYAGQVAVFVLGVWRYAL